MGPGHLQPRKDKTEQVNDGQLERARETGGGQEAELRWPARVHSPMSECRR